MVLIEPTSIDECIYFTKRSVGEGKIKAWACKGKCPKCSKGLMGKPKSEEGKVKIRAKEYQCPECKYTVEQNEYEASLKASVKYTCPHCKNNGEAEIPFKRKRVQRLDEESGKKETVDSLRFQCSKCGKDIDITKKMK